MDHRKVVCSDLRWLNAQKAIQGSDLVYSAKDKKLARVVQWRVSPRVDDEISVGSFHANHVDANAVSGIEFAQCGGLQSLRKHVDRDFFEVDRVCTLNADVV